MVDQHGQELKTVFHTSGWRILISAAILKNALPVCLQTCDDLTSQFKYLSAAFARVHATAVRCSMPVRSQLARGRDWR